MHLLREVGTADCFGWFVQVNLAKHVLFSSAECEYAYGCGAVHDGDGAAVLQSEFEQRIMATRSSKTTKKSAIQRVGRLLQAPIKAHATSPLLQIHRILNAFVCERDFANCLQTLLRGQA